MCSFHKQISTMSVRQFQVTVDSVAERRLNKVYARLWKLLKLLKLLLFSCRCCCCNGALGLQHYDSEVPSYLLQCCLSICADSFLLTLCREKAKETSLDLMIGCIILILQRLLLVLVTFCTIYVVCKSSDPCCAPNNSQAVCPSCSSLSLLLWKQIVPSFLGRIFTFSVIRLWCIKNWESRHCYL